MADSPQVGPIRVDHVGIAVESVADADPVLRALGCERLVDETVEDRFRWVYYRLGDASRVELVEPVEEGTFLTDFLDDHGPGLHHVTLEVADIDVAVAALEASDAPVEVVDRATFEDWHEAFVSPRNPTGTLFQLIEHRESYAEGRAPPAELFVNGERLGARTVASESRGDGGAGGSDGDGEGSGAGAAGADAGPAVGEGVDPAAAERIGSDPFHDRLGIEVVALAEGAARVRLPVTPGLANAHDTVHGAAVYAVADAAFAAASNAAGPPALALETNVSYLEAVDPADGTLVADAVELHRRGRTAAYHVDVREHDADATVPRTPPAPASDAEGPTDTGAEAGTTADGRRVATFRGRVYLPD